MGLNRRKLKDWVARRLLTVPKAHTFVLLHQGNHGLSKVCDLPASSGSSDDRAAAVERVVGEESRDHVDGHPGRQQYIVSALDAEGKDIGEHPFWLTASGSNATTALAHPPPELDGVHAAIPIDPQRIPDMTSSATMLMIQQMRHNESLVRINMEMATNHAERDAEIIRSQQQMIDRMEGRRLETIDLLEQLLSRKQERDMVQAEHDNQENRRERAMTKLEEVVFPAIMRSALVKGLLKTADDKGAVTEDVADEIKKIIMSLPPDMQKEMIEALGEEESHRLMDLFSRGHEKRTPEEAKH